MIKDTIIIHHSLTKDGNVVDFDAIKRYHIETKGWKDIGYHWVIEKVAGQIIVRQGRKEDTEGAHSKEANMNKRAIGICIVGNFDLAPPTQDYLNALIKLIKEIKTRHNIIEIATHNKYATYKSCPGKQFPMSYVISMLKTPEIAKSQLQVDIETLVNSKEISSPDIWSKETYTKDNVKSLINKYANYVRKQGGVK